MGTRLASAAVAAALLLQCGAAAALDEEEARRLLAERFEVEVLRIRPAVVGDRPAWLVTVMRPGGDSNDAFQVTTLALDRESGELIPSVRHSASGYQAPPPAAGAGGREPGQLPSAPRNSLR